MTYHAPAPGPEMYLEHAAFVRSVARALVRGDADVDDVVQATWLSVLTGGPKRSLPVRGWLATVTRRRAADLHRSRARVARREHAAARPEATASTEKLAEKAELGRRMVGAVLALDEPYRSAILLRYYEDLPPREMARRLNVPVETARTRVRRGLGQLRERFDRDEGGDRRAWMAAFLPLASGPTSVSVAAAAAGTGYLLKLALAALVVVGAFFVWRSVEDEPENAVPAATARETPDPVLRGRADATEAVVATAPHVRGTIEGVVLRGKTPVAARVELRRLVDPSEGAPLLVPHPDWLYGGVVGSGEPMAITTSGADGRFAFADIIAGDYEARAVDGRTAASARVRLRGAKPGTGVRLLLPEGPPMLQGRAVHANGRPFRGWIRVHVHEGASVTIAPFGVDLSYGDGLFAVDEEGRFEIYGVSPGAIRLAAFRPGEVRYLSAPVVVPHAEGYTFVVDAGTGGVRGRVVDRAGDRPIIGAVVIASAMADSGGLNWARVHTDRDGFFRLPLPDHDLSLEVSAAGYVTSRRGAEPLGGAEYRFPSWGHFVVTGGPAFSPAERTPGGEVRVRLVRAPRVSGRVVERESKRPVAGISVWAVAADFSYTGAWGRAVTRSDGSFLLGDVPAGRVSVFAAGEGWISAELAESTTEHITALAHRLEPGREIALELEVVPAVRAAGRVVDTSGAPVVGAAVRAQPTGAFPPVAAGYPMWLGSAVTDGGGRFVLDPLVADHRYCFYAQPPEGVLTATDEIAVGPAGLDDLEIRIAAPAWLRVRVLDGATGEGIAHARVRATPKNRQQLLPRAFLTGEDGRVLVGPVPADWVRLTACAAGYLRELDIPAPFDAREEAGREITLRLNPGSVIAGRVTAPDGVEVRGLAVLVDVPARKIRRSNHSPGVRTDASGAFRIDGLPPEGECTLSAGVDHGLVSYVGQVTTQAGDLAADLRLARDETATAWAVHVRDPEGRPVPAAVARLHVRETGGRFTSESKAVESGSVVLRTRRPVEEAWIEILAARDAAGVPLPAATLYRHDVPSGGGEIEVRLDTPQRITGVVQDAGRAGAAGVMVYAHPAYKPVPRRRRTKWAHEAAKTDAEGRFALERLGDGLYSLVIVCPASQRSPEPVQVQAGSENLVIVLDPAVQPRVEVRDAKGAAVVGARVAALPVKPRPGMRDPDPEARTDRSGAALLPALVPDQAYRLRVEPPPERNDLAPFELSPWVPVNRSVMLAFAAPIAGRVTDEAGEPFRRANVLWRPTGGVWTTMPTQKDGTFLIEKLPRDQTIELYARAGFAGASEPVADRIVRVRPGDMNVGLTARRPVELHVRVKDWPRDVGEVMAYLRPEGGHPMVTCVQNGRVRYANISPEQTYTFYAGPLPDGRYARATGIVPGEGEVIATLQVGLEIRGRLRLPAGATKPHAWVVDGAMSAGGNDALSENGTFVFRGLYPGTWTVNASAYIGGIWKHIEIPVEAGATNVIITVE